MTTRQAVREAADVGGDFDTIASAIERGDLTAVEAVNGCLAKIDALDADHAVFVRVHRDEALDTAEQRDAELRRGISRGPLHGVPFAVKDLIDIAGYPNSCGTAHRADIGPARQHAGAVKALTDAGAVVIGQANLHEWALGGTSDNPAYGTVLNLWGEGRMPGGSSGGSAVAVSGGMAAFSIGTDTGGSIREPASFTGTAGLKVTGGSVSTEGVFPVSWAMDTVGPMARRVAELRRPYEVMAHASNLQRREVARHHNSLAGTRLGVFREYYLEQSRIEPEVYRVFTEAVEKLVAAGVEIVDVQVPSLPAAMPAFYAICLAEAAAVHSGGLRANRPDYGADIQALLALGDVVPASSYIAAMRFRAVLRAEFKKALSTVDFMIAPGTPFTATKIGQETLTWPDGSEEGLLDAAIRYTFPANLTGVPTLCQPCGLTDGGLPVGFQLIGEPHSESALLDLGELVEFAVGWQSIPPIVESLG